MEEAVSIIDTSSSSNYNGRLLAVHTLGRIVNNLPLLIDVYDNV
jgi:hypothetical protein